MIIRTKNATKYIRGALILDKVNVEFESGKIYGLQGPNGSGKTMLMRLVGGLIRPTSGEVYIDENKLGQSIDFPTSMGLLIENPAFLPNYTGLKNLELLAGIKGNVSLEQLRQTIRDVGLNPDDKRKYRKYSLGMKQRLGIAAAIMEKPDLILMDEPTNALDDTGVEQICQLLRRERDRGALILMACHDAAILEQMSDEIYTIYEGKVERKIRT
ncbi:MAG: ATP-binding cassette domain-containing protein [Oscillospiraceae bacterium]|nr:ATP-binding cassette domain-containing protein [Oscillospiraceae bacterium]